jgi:hypothetical protein
MSLMSVLVVLLALSAVIIATSSMRRKGRMTAPTQWVFIGILLIILVAVAVMEWLSRTGT